MNIKCVIWDLDNTLWDGILMEGDQVRLREGVQPVIETLDTWGILHSIASQNDESLAQAALERFGLSAYFLTPQINFSPKPDQISAIASALDLRIEDLALVDDDPFQRAQAAGLLPGLQTFTDVEGLTLPSRPGLQPASLSAEARARRSFYRSRLERDRAEAGYISSGKSRLTFLQSCALRLRIRRALPEDTPRLFELVERTNQLNAAAQRYPYDQVRSWIDSPDYDVWAGELTDRFGEYGLVGLAVVERKSPWLIKVLLVSCRAMGRGVGEGLLSFVVHKAHAEAQGEIQAIYRKTPYNSAMRLLLASHGFRPNNIKPDHLSKEEETGDTGIVVFSSSLSSSLPSAPPWLEITGTI